MAEKTVQLDPFVADVAGCVDAHRLLPAGGRVVVGVSGGADSVALLDVLRRLARQPGRAYALTAAHLDHALRADSEADAAFVADLARRWDLPCVAERRDVGAVARREGLGVEAAARMVRYAFLADAARSAGAETVAVGHHADDNVETLLQRIVRGTHLRGLAGMPIRRPIGPAGPTPMLVRPLLGVRRSEIEAYCRRCGLAWRTDPTNADTTYRRNFIRHELLPLLRERLNPKADEALLRLAEAADEVEAFLAGHAERALADARREMDAQRAVLDAAVLADQHPVVCRWALRATLERLGVSMRAVDHQHLRALADLAGRPAPAAVDLPGRYRARREGDHLVIVKEKGVRSLFPEQPGGCFAQKAPDPFLVELNCPGRTDLPDGRCVVCRTFPLDRRELAAHLADPQLGVEWLDADAVRGRLVCRRRQDGDAFIPLGGPGRQSVSDFLTNLKLPASERRRALCLLDDAGLVYLAPLRLADRVKITPHTTRVLRVDIRPAPQPLESAGASP